MQELTRTADDDPSMRTPRYTVERCAHARGRALVLFGFLGERYVALAGTSKSGLLMWLGAEDPEPAWQQWIELLLAEADRG